MIKVVFIADGGFMVDLDHQARVKVVLLANFDKLAYADILQKVIQRGLLELLKQLEEQELKNDLERKDAGMGRW